MRGAWLPIALLLAPGAVLAKGSGVDVYVEGTVVEAREEGEDAVLRVRGTLDIVARSHPLGRMRIGAEAPIAVRTRPGIPCLVLLDGRGSPAGPCDEGRLAARLQRAAREGTRVQLWLKKAALHFLDGDPAVEVTASETIALSPP